MFSPGINVLKNETLLSQGDTTWMRVIAQGILLLAVLVVVVMVMMMVMMMVLVLMVVMVHSKYPYTAPRTANTAFYEEQAETGVLANEFGGSNP